MSLISSAIAPADPAVHFALVLLYLDRGWRTLAADKLLLIGRLAQLRKVGPQGESFPLILDDPFIELDTTVKPSLLELLGRPQDLPLAFTTSGAFGRVGGSLRFVQPGSGISSLASALLNNNSGRGIDHWETAYPAAGGLPSPGFPARRQGLDFLGSAIVAEVATQVVSRGPLPQNARSRRMRHAVSAPFAPAFMRSAPPIDPGMPGLPGVTTVSSPLARLDEVISLVTLKIPVLFVKSASRTSIPEAGTGLENRNPWPSSQPSSARTSRCAAVSIPSAMTPSRRR